MPTGKQYHQFNPVFSPTLTQDPVTTMPIGLGAVATGGTTLSPMIEIGQFDSDVDIYFALHVPNVDPFNVYFLSPDGSTLEPFSNNMVPWMQATRGGVTHSPWGDLPTSILPPGPYHFFLIVIPAGQTDTFHVWTTTFTNQ